MKFQLFLRAQLLRAAPLLLAAAFLAGSSLADAKSKRKGTRSREQVAAPAAVQDGAAEARLIEIYRLVGQARNREALGKAEKLVREFPNFQLAQLIYGDLLSSQARPIRMLGDVPDTAARAAAGVLDDLRSESQMRIKALTERPPAGAVPSQFLTLSTRSKHAIAVDTSRARLYLFENGPSGLRLIADYYVSVGKLGIEKVTEGDLRTPLGVYYITNTLDPRTLKDFYGAGALPINYPNPYDRKRGKTGGGIWLHGSPPSQFSRAPKSTDGCVALSNPDLERIMRTVEIRSTPVVIAQRLDWVAPLSLRANAKAFDDVLQAWSSAKSSGNLERTLSFYSADFTSYGKTLAEWKPSLKEELARLRGRELQLKDLSLLSWKDSTDIMVVTFGEVPNGAASGATRRQYWLRQLGQWKIFFEGVIG